MTKDQTIKNLLESYEQDFERMILKTNRKASNKNLIFSELD